MIVEMQAEDKVLEIGCGVHKIFGKRSIGIDKSSFSNAEIIRDVAKRGIPFQDNYFDIVISMDVIEHIESYEDLIFFINEIYRVLKPDKKWLFTTPDGIQGLSHITHHRFFTKGSFEYFADNLSAEMENMRKSDGIIAKFRIDWDDTSKEVLSGIFCALK